MTNRKEAATIADVDVAVVGAGAAGVGVGVALRHAGVENLVLLDRHGVGASFDRWPAEMRFITPSFATNSIGMLDINSVAIGTSPAFSLQSEHPSGKEYAAYLRGVAQHFELPVRGDVNVYSIAPDGGGFMLTTIGGPIRAQFIVWAAGEFQYPQTVPFPGAALCRHNATISSWKSVAGKEAIVIGGYESGIDAAIHLARLGTRVTVLDRSDTAPWNNESADPSVTLSTYTTERLRDTQVARLIRLASGADVFEVRKYGRGYRVCCTSGKDFVTKSPPILATGFRGSVTLVADLFSQREDCYLLLNKHDESTRTPGLFVCGPMVRHEQHIFCFIYKFRQRFAVVAKAIANRLNLPAEQLETYRQWGMYLDDLSCCGEECMC
ncbi:MAG: NAD(P)-binding domain-containing protein [Planctomycetota bacterium]|nr:NAD(P)-binding domain-containing protein [Planctomycetota bacterium]MDA1179708.1 NAD(P)-binding domain-containing protein [Planctomycetota bacterium]